VKISATKKCFSVRFANREDDKERSRTIELKIDLNCSTTKVGLQRTPSSRSTLKKKDKQTPLKPLLNELLEATVSNLSLFFWRHCGHVFESSPFYHEGSPKSQAPISEHQN